MKRLLLIFLFAGIVTLVIFRNIGDWLAICDHPQKADIIVCLGGGAERIKMAAQLLQAGYSDTILATTHNVYTQLLKLKIPENHVLHPRWLPSNTFKESLLIKETLVNAKATTALVVTDPYHQYRVKWSIEKNTNDNPLKFFYVSSEASSMQGFWWDNIESRKLVLNEIPKILYYWAWHGILDLDHDPAWIVNIGKMYVAMFSNYF